MFYKMYLFMNTEIWIKERKKQINTREPNGELGPDVRFPLFFGNIGNLDCTVTGSTLGFYLVLHLVFRRTRGLKGTWFSYGTRGPN